MDISSISISGATVACISVSMVFCILFPIALMILWAVKRKTSIIPALFGAGTFLVFAMILETILHQLILGAIGQEKFMALPFYAVYGGLAAGIFEECGRYIAMRCFMKKKLGKKESVMFGIGHGGIESIIMVGVTFAGNLSLISMLQNGGINAILAPLDEASKAQVIGQLAVIGSAAPASFLIASLERAFAITFHICASYLVYRAVKYSKPLLLAAAILLHALMDGIAVVFSRLTGSTVATEAFIGVFTLVVAVITVIAYRKEKETLSGEIA